MTSEDERSRRLEDTLVEVAVDAWRLGRLFAKVVNKLDAGEQSRYASQLRYIHKKIEDQLESVGLRLVSVEGQPFDPGLAASAVNLGDFDPADKLLIEHMVEPIVMGLDGLRRAGTVIVRKVHV